MPGGEGGEGGEDEYEEEEVSSDEQNAYDVLRTWQQVRRLRLRLLLRRRRWQRRRLRLSPGCTPCG
jgi:hypothetical protein